MRKTALLLLAGLAGCAPKPAATTAATPAATPAVAGAATAAPTPPALRLPEGPKPLRYRADLTVIPGQPDFQGTLGIDLSLPAPAGFLWLDAIGIDVKDASIVAGGRTIAAKATPAGKEYLGLAFASPVPAGTATLNIRYTGVISDDEVTGLFHQTEDGNDYAFTQFEELGARRVFPCFDEPSYKTPWQLTLHVKKDAVAISNTPEKSRVDEDGGKVAIAFEETRPLPSYLVAFAVGPFEIVDGGRSAHGAPIRIVVPKGHVAEASFASKTEAAIVDHLEDYFSIPYPYPKLDVVVIPHFFGAMENAGMITSLQTGVLVKPEEETIRFRRDFHALMLHETAHQWFGDLVTTRWWDDIWLNEAFANWMQTHVTIDWKPDWRPVEGYVAGRDRVMEQDALTSARKIRQPIESDDDIENAFDAITYDKGEAVLYMTEAWVGRDAFRKGVHDYLVAHADGNATTPEFLSALSAAAGKDVSGVVSSFADSTGLPLVSVKLDCPKGGKPSLHLSQKRFLPLGSTGSESQTWKIPVCVRYDAHRACTLFETPETDLALPEAASCPKTVVANDRATGYYRVAYDPALLDALVAHGAKALFPEEKIALLEDVSALALAGKVPLQDTLARVTPFANDPDRHVVSAVIGLAAGLDSASLVPDELRPNYARWVRKLWGARARALGFTPKPGEDEDTRLLRPGLLSLVGDDGDDRQLQAQAAVLARKWLAQRGTPEAKSAPAVDPELTGTVLDLAAIGGDRALFDAVKAAAKSETDLHERDRLAFMLMRFRDPALFREALGMILGDFPAMVRVRMLFGAFSDHRNRPTAYRFVRDHFDAIAAGMPTDLRGRLLWIGGDLCDRTERSDYASFFKDRAPTYEGGPRDYTQVLETIDLCEARKDAEQPGVVAFLKGY